MYSTPPTQIITAIITTTIVATKWLKPLHIQKAWLIDKHTLPPFLAGHNNPSGWGRSGEGERKIPTLFQPSLFPQVVNLTHNLKLSNITDKSSNGALWGTHAFTVPLAFHCPWLMVKA